MSFDYLVLSKMGLQTVGGLNLSVPGVCSILFQLCIGHSVVELTRGLRQFLKWKTSRTEVACPTLLRWSVVDLG